MIQLKKILIFGLFETSPGKTVVSATLSRGIRNEGLRVAPFKPRSGHNLWYQHDSYDICKKRESLFCEDIIKLRKAAKCNLPYEVLNPVDALMAPMDASIYLSNNNIRSMYIDENNTFNNLIVERYTSCKNESLKYNLCLNKTQLNNIFFERDFINKLISRVNEVVEVKSLDEWCSVSQRFGPESISNCFARVSEACDVVVVEGFNDAVCPAPGLKYDVVIGIGPGISAFYDSADFQRAIDVLSTTGHNRMNLRSRDVIKYIKTLEIQPIQAIEMNHLEKYDFLCEKLKNVLDAALKRL